MSTHENRNDDALRADGLLDDELRRRYRALADEQPSAETDEAILAAARREVGAGPQRRRRPGLWMGGLATAATVTLMVSALLPSWRSGDLQEEVAARPAPAASAPQREAASESGVQASPQASPRAMRDDISSLPDHDALMSDDVAAPAVAEASLEAARDAALRAQSAKSAASPSGHFLSRSEQAPAAAPRHADDSERQLTEERVAMAERDAAHSARRGELAGKAQAKKEAMTAAAHNAAPAHVPAPAAMPEAVLPSSAERAPAPPAVASASALPPSAPIADARTADMSPTDSRDRESEAVGASAAENRRADVPASFYAKPAAARRAPDELGGSGSAFSYEAALVHGWYAPALAWLEQPPQANDAGREAERDLLRWLLAPASPPALRCREGGAVSGQRLCLLLRRHAQGVVATDDELAALAAALRQERREPAPLLFALRQLPPPPAPVPERGISPAASSAPAP